MLTQNGEVEFPVTGKLYRVFESVLLEAYHPWMEWGAYAVPNDDLKIQVRALPLTVFAMLSHVIGFTGARMPEEFVGGCLLRTGLPIIHDMFEQSLARLRVASEAAGRPDFRFVGPSKYDSLFSTISPAFVPEQAENNDLFCLDFCDFTSLSEMSHTYDISMSTLAIFTVVAGLALSIRLVSDSMQLWAASFIDALETTLSDIDVSAA